jgi:hypothetical protein
MTKKRPEPEIIPPGEPGGEAAELRFYVARPGPVATVLVVLITGLLFVMLAGALLFVLPGLILFVTAVTVVALVRLYFQGGR